MDNNFSKYDSLDVLKLYDDPQFNCKQHVMFKTPEVVVSLQKQYLKKCYFYLFFNKVLYINNPLTSFAVVQIR